MCILTGGPGSGKTTLLSELATLGYQCVPETARAIIKLRHKKGLSPRPEPLDFAQQILDEDMVQYERLRDHVGPIFFDRGLVDGLAMCKGAGLLTQVECAKRLQNYAFNKSVFIFPTWPEIYRQDNERDQSLDDSRRVYAELSEWYLSLDFELEVVPEGSVSERVAFVQSVLVRE
ncbi:MAG: AAA family ATPase [Pseudomonadales bacterium]|nr:AAA family ATPase [Pseudomonadales bacterium]